MRPSAVIPSSNPFAPRRYGELQKISERVYLMRNITNSSFVIGSRSVAVIDTQVNRPSAEQLLRFIRSVTDKPISHVINTHYHWDHTNGNEVFKQQGARVIASKRTKEFMVERQDRQKEFLAGRGFELGRDPLLPEVTFEGDYSLDLGEQPLRLFFAGSAETEDATAVHCPAEKSLMSGDTVMTGSFPIFGQPCWDEGLEGDGRWQRTIRNLLSLAPAHIIPGHGPLAHKADVEFLIRIEDYFVEEVRALVQKGFDSGRVLKDLEPRLPDWITRLPLVWGTPRYAILRVYRGLTKKASDPEPGWQRFKPSAIPASDAAALGARVKGKENLGDLVQMASEAVEGGDTGLCLDILRKATELFERSPQAWVAYSEALIEASRAEDSVLEKGDFFQIAKRGWDKAMELEPGHVGALLGKGRYLTLMAYRGGDDPAAGMKLLETVVSMKPGGRPEAQAQFYIGIGYRRLGSEDKAIAQFQKALKADPAWMPPRLALQ